MFSFYERQTLKNHVKFLNILGSNLGEIILLSKNKNTVIPHVAWNTEIKCFHVY